MNGPKYNMLSNTISQSGNALMNANGQNPPVQMHKDRIRPKGPLTSFTCFVQVIREEHRKKFPNENVIIGEFSKKCAEKWKQMTPAERKQFDDMALLDRERYNREMTDYVPPEGLRKKKRKRTKDPGMPKRAWSAFFFFCDEFRPQIREQHPAWRVSEVAKELGRRWEECQDKAKYESKAQADRQRYDEDMVKYKNGTYVAPIGKRRHVTGTGDAASTSGGAAADDLFEEEGDDTEEVAESPPNGAAAVAATASRPASEEPADHSRPDASEASA